MGNAVQKIEHDVRGEDNVVELQSKIDAVSKFLAVIEFELDGTIIHANDNFLNALGYTEGEVVGKHHRMFCSKEIADSREYTEFWDDLAAGKSQTREFPRLKKDGEEIWINAAYSPIFDSNGKPFKVVKYATDITEMKMNAQMSQMVDLSPINTLLGNPEGIMMYMNDASRVVLKKLEHLLPDKVENLVGKSIDMFHQTPEKQRNIIKDPKNLPLQSKIKLGEETLDLLVSPVMDKDGTYVGPMVTWELITQKVSLVEELSTAAQHLSAASEELSASASQMISSSEATAGQSNQASASAEEVSKGVETVATNTEEMLASIKEISRNANEASTMSNSTRDQAEGTNTIIQKLGDSSLEIGNVIKVISSIAQQTNLLALNATIEAARAGDAGRGFAVVANEVKELAKQTAIATEDITSKIGAIQTDSEGAVNAIGEIGGSIDKLNSIAGAIAASVEEQLATTNEVARVVQDSNDGVKDITESIVKVSTAASETTVGANQVLEASKVLQDLADKLQELVGQIEV